MTVSTQRVTIVSGLPRSGTSVMMQMLVAGGMAALSDGVRVADADNPRGYFEFERVKKLKTDQSWLSDARGKVVKMVHLLLLDLPAETECDVVFMRRDLGEVARSQAVMLERSGKPGAKLSAEQLTAVYQQQIDRVLKTLAARPKARVIEVNYAEVVNQPELTARCLEEFLERGLDISAMARAVDPSLYRNRAG